MSLSSIPEELLAMILQYVGVEEFHGDIGRLTVCKRWYQISSLMIVERMIVTERSKRLPLHVLGSIRERLHTIEFKFAFCDHWPSAEVIPSLRKKGVCFDVDTIRNVIHFCKDWNSGLLESCKKLRTIHIQGLALVHGGVPSILFGFNTSPETSLGLSIGTSPLTLTDLHLDFCRVAVDRIDRFAHLLCKTIPFLLPSLRRFWVRKGIFCPKDLELSSKYRQIPLESLIVNLVVPSGIHRLPYTSLDCKLVETMIKRRPVREPVALHYEGDVQGIISAAARISECAPLAHTIRVLYLSDGSMSPNHQDHPAMMSFDVLTGVSRRLPHDARWDDDPADYSDEAIAADQATVNRYYDMPWKEGLYNTQPRKEEMAKPAGQRNQSDGTEPMDLAWP
ncbi:MAG: hypothetical protein Q9165_002158 [Trypethelium subeluteriae]